MATSYANPGGTGDRTATIAVTSAQPIAGSNVNNLVDGSFANDMNGSIFFLFSDNNVFEFDFTTLGAQVIDEIKWYQNVVHTNGDWQFEGFNTSTLTWDVLAGPFTLGSPATQTVAFANTTAYFLYRLNQTLLGASAIPWLQEIEFKLESGTPPTPVDPIDALLIQRGPQFSQTLTATTIPTPTNLQFAITEQRDELAITGYPGIGGALDATEQNDTMEGELAYASLPGFLEDQERMYVPAADPPMKIPPEPNSPFVIPREDTIIAPPMCMEE